MRVLQIGTDRTIFDSNSASASRMRAYGKRFGGLDIIVFSLIKHGVQDTNLSEHVRVHATNSFFRFMYVWGAVWLSFKLPKPDVVSVQDPFETGIAGWLIARLRGSALHVQLHTDFLSPEFSRLSLLNRLRVQIAGFVLRRASRIRVVSERIKRSLKTKNYKLKTEPTVLPIFVDVEKYRNAQVSPKLAAHEHLFRTKLLVVSRLEPEKNVGLAIHAFAKAALENSCLIIIGEGREGEKLHQMAIQRGVSKWVFFEGQTDPAQYYKIADLLLAPSRYEGYGMVVVEALAAGTPVISTDVGVAREAGAIIAEEDDFAKAITNWFANGSSTGESADFVARPAATTGGSSTDAATTGGSSTDAATTGGSSTDAATTGGPKEGKLLNYPYKNFEEYVKAYCKDIESST